MPIAGKVKALLKLKGKENIQLAEHLGISKQSLSNKFYRDSFSATDLIKIADFLGCSLAFIVDDVLRIALNVDDIKE
jgi:transcriptional regulator with XRE-family HTH domain